MNCIELFIRIRGKDKDIKYTLAGGRENWEDYFVKEPDSPESAMSRFLNWVRDDLENRYGKTYEQWEDERTAKYRKEADNLNQ